MTIYMVKGAYVNAKRVYHHKVVLYHRSFNFVAIAEIKVWKVDIDGNYPEGLKYSLFLVDPEAKSIIFGIDNHKPKGHHQHQGKRETAYNFQTVEQLVEDFWKQVEKEGFIL